ncbi:hypothetical protein [Stratiformator vulcanicus]|uniref:Uncharacterized protein n=1 Tax=Stratiformator vulcanicus TaxID=2527980 RepID=A0A517R640_9PLAN|nr:hypothetical protein [Stratiformator vulcanicus]QDT39366.1 hypothetical protein Pan189_37720 [Stratiformator vulcanicus]
MRRVVRYIALTLGCSIVLLGFSVAMTFSRLDDSYAQWGAAEMVIYYMEDHDGKWPDGWADLQPYFDAGGSRVSGWSYDTFQQHVWIDFSADPAELHKLSQGATSPPFNVIDSTSVFAPQFEDGPNGILMRYFNPDARNLNPTLDVTLGPAE